MIAAYMLAGELSASQGRYQQAFASYEARLRSYIAARQRGAERFARAFAPRTRAGLNFRNLVISTQTIWKLLAIAIGEGGTSRQSLNA
jgi:2-polyprenyl-6-methoxyphenol hydroxylase-like FAD-dependent oxidoreductase